MVTGIETAGLALAIFPLVVCGIQFYADGARTIKEMWRPASALSTLSRDLEMEKCKFENTCTLLLEGLVSDSELKLLLERPKEALWSTDDLQNKLKSRLNPTAVKCYMEAMEALVSKLQNLQDKFKLNEADKLDLADKKKFKKGLRRAWAVLSKAEHEKILADITKINSDLATLTGQSKLANALPQVVASANQYKQIRNHAINLYGVLKEKLQAASSCECTVPHNANLHLEVRSIPAAKNDCNRMTSLRFHVVFSFGNDRTVENTSPRNWREIDLEPLGSKEEPWESEQTNEANNSDDPDNGESLMDINSPDKTGDKIDHPAISRTSRLAIEHPLGGHIEPTKFPRPQIPAHKTSWRKSLVLFKRTESVDRPAKPSRNVSFSLPQASRVDLASAGPSFMAIDYRKRIQNLCLTIQEAKSGHCHLGILIDENNRRYSVWSPEKQLLISKPTGMLSLEELLRLRTLTREDRLILGVQLASTVMQLHTTEWLSENWGKGDILFHQETTQDGTRGPVNFKPIPRQPFIRQTFTSSQKIIQEPKKSIHAPRNQSLFSLGITLIELWYGQRIEDLRTEADGNGSGGATDSTAYMTAWRLIDEISNEAGGKYGDAVRRCILGLDHRHTDLESDEFKNEVHVKVVSPLIENLESFCDMGLAKILQDDVGYHDQQRNLRDS